MQARLWRRKCQIGREDFFVAQGALIAPALAAEPLRPRRAVALLAVALCLLLKQREWQG